MSWWRKKHFTKLSEILVFTQFAKPQLQKRKFIFWIMTTCFYTVHWGVPPQEVGREISSGPRPSSRERAVTWHWHYPTVAYDLDHTTTRLALHRGQYRTQQYWNCTVRPECSWILLFKLLDISQDKKTNLECSTKFFFLTCKERKGPDMIGDNDPCISPVIQRLHRKLSTHLSFNGTLSGSSVRF